jgi:NAD(P)-dependent dehydrogenase (short-subunit alcohol dehydrogenase family)
MSATRLMRRFAFGDVHVVFNNAGIAYAGPIAQTSHDDWRL